MRARVLFDFVIGIEMLCLADVTSDHSDGLGEVEILDGRTARRVGHTIGRAALRVVTLEGERAHPGAVV
jgi:hypothetical protein